MRRNENKREAHEIVRNVFIFLVFCPSPGSKHRTNYAQDPNNQNRLQDKGNECTLGTCFSCFLLSTPSSVKIKKKFI